MHDRLTHALLLLSGLFVADLPAQPQLQAGLRITGRSPQLHDLRVVAAEPTPTVNVTVDHPVRQLIDQAGKVVGVRKPERRTMMLWLEETEAGFRIADSVELGAQSLETEPDPGRTAPAMTLSMEQTAG